MRILLLNQFVPPDPAPTARLLGAVGEELERRGHEVVFLGCGDDYRGGKTLLGSRALREGFALARLLLAGWFAVPRCDAILFLTSPPLLPALARPLRWRHRRARLVHWAMDLYPEVAVALGEVREGSALHRVTAHLASAAYRCCDAIIALDTDMAERIALHGPSCQVQPPWPPEIRSFGSSEDGVSAVEKVADPEVNSADSADSADCQVSHDTSSETRKNRSTDPPFTWLYSGNLGRAHEWRTLLEAQARLEASGVAAELVFQGGGTEWAEAREHAERLGLERCAWRPYAPAEELIVSLLAADCLVVTQRPETAGCLWPSKLALALLLERPVLWVGATESAPARQVAAAGHVCAAPGEAEGLAEQVAFLAAATEPGARPVPSCSAIADEVRRLCESGVRRVADAVCAEGEAVGRLGGWAVGRLGGWAVRR